MRLPRFNAFSLKWCIALVLALLADHLFWMGRGFGSNLGIFSAALIGSLLIVSPRMRRDRRALVAIALASGFCLMLGDDPSWLALSSFWLAISSATLLPMVTRIGNGADWLARLLVRSLVNIIGPWQDFSRLVRVRRGAKMLGCHNLLPLLALPVVGGSVFLALFAAANPLIGTLLAQVRLPESLPERTALGLISITISWSVLRPRRLRWGIDQRPLTTEAARLPGVSIGSVTLSLLLFNALFALQNGLDVAFLWGGSPLPDGYTLADYAHRGSYPLIVTALLAGLFVLVTLRPGSDTAGVLSIRRLVALWVAQNVILVASSILRTLDYIDVYSLTRLRLAALMWMVLVGVGLMLILWRLLAGKSAAWLINANLLTAGLVLTVCSAVDLGSVAASWNVRHAREVGGKGAALDLCYLSNLGPSALVSLTELETRVGLNAVFADRIAFVQSDIGERVTGFQQRGFWTWRNARRLAQVEALALTLPSGLPRPAVSSTGRNCDGSHRIPPVTPLVVTSSDRDIDATDKAAALTNEAGQ